MLLMQTNEFMKTNEFLTLTPTGDVVVADLCPDEVNSMS